MFSPVAPSDRRRVLVIDDEPALGRSLRRLLGREHEVVVSGGGYEAIELLRRDPNFHVIFCDMLMPGCTGPEVYETLQKVCPGLERRLIFMTGGAFTIRARTFLASVPNPRIDKPFHLETLRAMVRTRLAEPCDPDPDDSAPQSAALPPL